MNDKTQPSDDSLTPSGYDEYGDGSEQANTPEQVRRTERRREAEREASDAVTAENERDRSNAGESPLG